MLIYLYAVLAACANAVASVLQRKANKDIPQEEQMSARLIWDLLHDPFWFGGIAAVTAGFLLQAAALSTGQLAVVEPILVIELPITIVIAWRVFSGDLQRREWLSLVGMTVGLVGLIWFLSPRGGRSTGVAWWMWAIGLFVGAVVIGALVVAGRRARNSAARAALYGIATGVGFGITAALIKGMTNALQGGIVGLLTAWQTYLMIVAGAASMYLLQNAVNAGRLMAAQPGITLTDPVVSIVWGILVFDEQVRQGWYVVLAIVSMAVIGVSVTVLTRSPLMRGPSAGQENVRDGGPPQDAGIRRTKQRAAT